MRRAFFVFLAAAALAGCVGTPSPAPKETYLKAVDVNKIEDASGCYIAGRFIDSTFTPLGFMSGPRFYLSVQNLDTGEITWMPFSREKNILYYELAPGRYVISQVIKEVALTYETGSAGTQKIRKQPYVLPDALQSEFTIAAGEVLYLGTLTPKDEPNSSRIVYDNDYAKTQKALIRAAYIMEDFVIRAYLEPEDGETDSGAGQ